MPVSDFKPARKKAAPAEPKAQTRPYLHVALDADQARRIKLLAIEEDCNLTQLVMRGLNLILEKRGLPPL